jgi:hypothetical protein
MNKKFLVFLFILISVKSFGQPRFDKGYIIDNNNKTTECYIKNLDWKNPTEVEAKSSETDPVKIIPASSIKEFCIYGSYKYINRTVQIDRSPGYFKSLTDYDRLSAYKDPTWSTEQLMLKVLVEGKASLYYYEQGNLMRFFYSVSDSIMPLIYKLYKVETKDKKEIYKNTTYRQQLWVDLMCSNVNESFLNKLGYTFDELVKYFRNYNDCVGENYVDYSKITNREIFNIKITPGVNLSKIALDNGLSNKNDFQMHYLCFRLGIESEFFLPFYNNRLSIFFEPTYNYFKTTKYFAEDTAYLKYNSIEFPIGLRYYSYLNESSKLFFDGQYISNFSYIFNSSLKFNRPPSFAIKDGASFSIGAGVLYKNLSAEIRFYTNRKILSDYYFWSNDYIRYSFVVGYKLFNHRN